MDGISSVQLNLSSNLFQTQSTSRQTSNDSKPSLADWLQNLEKDVNSGKINASDLKSQLEDQFGSVVDDAFNDDGSVDFDKLESILTDQMQSLTGDTTGTAATLPPPPPPEQPSSSSFSSSSTYKIDPSTLQKNLNENFGDEADGIVSDDGTIDYEKLKELLDNKMGTQSTDTQSAYNSTSALFLTGSLFSTVA